MGKFISNSRKRREDMKNARNNTDAVDEGDNE